MVGLVRVRGAAPVPPDRPVALCTHAGSRVCVCVMICVSFVRAGLLHVNSTVFLFRELPYGGGPGGMTGWSLRYQGELLGLRDPQNRDLRRKPPPETVKSVG